MALALLKVLCAYRAQLSGYRVLPLLKWNTYETIAALVRGMSPGAPYESAKTHRCARNGALRSAGANRTTMDALVGEVHIVDGLGGLRQCVV